MNPRIKELAEQSGLKVESWMTNPPKPFQILGSTEQFEKFAELIVRECMNICAEREKDIRTRIKDEGKAATAYMIRADIKEYFGVEE